MSVADTSGWRVAVVGGGIAGLAAAFDLACAGARVSIVEPGELGGTVRRGEVAGLPVDLGADSYAVATGTVQRLLADLDLVDSVVRPAAGAAWVRHEAGIGPLPAGSWLGVPARPWSASVRRVIGWPGVARSLWDLALPRRQGSSVDLAALVHHRFGGRVLRRLVDPVVAGVYSTSPAAMRLDGLPAPIRDALAGNRSLARAVRTIGRDLSTWRGGGRSGRRHVHSGATAGAATSRPRRHLCRGARGQPGIGRGRVAGRDVERRDPR